MKNKLLYCNIQFVFQASCKINNFLHLKTKFCCFYVLTFLLFLMLPIMARSSVILGSEFLGWEFRHSLGAELKMMIILQLRNIFYSAITHLILRISQLLLRSGGGHKVALMESLLASFG